MPCYKPSEDEVELEKLRSEVEYLRDTNNKLESYLCAVLQKEEEEVMCFKTFIEECEEEYKVPGLGDWWDEHLEKDKKRLLDVVRGLSEGEKFILKGLL